MSLEHGMMLGGCYRVKRRLGGGNFGDVYLAEELHDNVVLRQVAIKVLRQGVIVNPDAGSMDLLREYAAMVAAVEAASPESRRHFIQTYTIDSDPEHGRYLVMEYLNRAATLEHLIEDHKMAGYHPSAERTISYARQLFAALATLHQAGFVHCDVKPDNLYIQGDTLRVGDFGLALRSPAGLSDGEGAGQIYYMAPEVFGQKVSPASDVYSAGLTIYEFWTGKHPFKRRSNGLIEGDNASLLQLRFRDQWAYLPGKQVEATVSESPLLDRVLARSLARSLEERYRNASEVVAAFDAIPEPVLDSWQQAMQRAQQALPDDVVLAEEALIQARALVGQDEVRRFETLMLSGETALQSCRPGIAKDYFAQALGLDTKSNLLFRNRDRRIELLQKLIRACHENGEEHYAALYQRRLDGLAK